MSSHDENPLGWMRNPRKNEEEYLLGQKVDEQVEQDVTSRSNADTTQVDMARKIREDPMTLIAKKQMEAAMNVKPTLSHQLRNDDSYKKVVTDSSRYHSVSDNSSSARRDKEERAWSRSVVEKTVGSSMENPKREDNYLEDITSEEEGEIDRNLSRFGLGESRQLGVGKYESSHAKQKNGKENNNKDKPHSKRSNTIISINSSSSTNHSGDERARKESKLYSPVSSYDSEEEKPKKSKTHSSLGRHFGNGRSKKLIEASSSEASSSDASSSGEEVRIFSSRPLKYIIDREERTKYLHSQSPYFSGAKKLKMSRTSDKSKGHRKKLKKDKKPSRHSDRDSEKSSRRKMQRTRMRHSSSEGDRKRMLRSPLPKSVSDRRSFKYYEQSRSRTPRDDRRCAWRTERHSAKKHTSRHLQHQYDVAKTRRHGVARSPEHTSPKMLRIRPGHSRVKLRDRIERQSSSECNSSPRRQPILPRHSATKLHKRIERSSSPPYYNHPRKRPVPPSRPKVKKWRANYEASSSSEYDTSPRRNTSPKRQPIPYTYSRVQSPDRIVILSSRENSNSSEYLTSPKRRHVLPRHIKVSTSPKRRHVPPRHIKVSTSPKRRHVPPGHIKVSTSPKRRHVPPSHIKVSTSPKRRHVPPGHIKVSTSPKRRHVPPSHIKVSTSPKRRHVPPGLTKVSTASEYLTSPKRRHVPPGHIKVKSRERYERPSSPKRRIVLLRHSRVKSRERIERPSPAEYYTSPRRQHMPYTHSRVKSRERSERRSPLYGEWKPKSTAAMMDPRSNQRTLYSDGPTLYSDRILQMQANANSASNRRRERYNRFENQPDIVGAPSPYYDHDAFVRNRMIEGIKDATVESQITNRRGNLQTPSTVLQGPLRR